MESTFNKRLGNRLKLARISSYMSRAIVAGSLAVSEETVRTWEIGLHSPSPEQLANIGKLYAVPVGYFFGEITSDLDRARERSPQPANGAGER